TQANLTRTWRSHTIKSGFETRVYRSFDASPGNTSGSYNFTRQMTSRDANTGDATSGNSYASFLLGYPSSGSVAINELFAWQNLYYVLYAQDDCEVNDRLRLTVALRWDHEALTTECFNR